MAYDMFFSSPNIWFRKVIFSMPLFNAPLQCCIVLTLLRTAAGLTFSSAKLYRTCSYLDSFISFYHLIYSECSDHNQMLSPDTAHLLAWPLFTGEDELSDDSDTAILTHDTHTEMLVHFFMKTFILS